MRGLVILAPDTHCFQYRAETIAELRQGIFYTRRDFGVDCAGKQAVGLH